MVLDQVAGDRTALVSPLPGRTADLAGTHGADAIRPGEHLLDRQPGGERRTVIARERRLTVLVVDVFGDHAGLGALELFLLDAVLDELGYHAVHRVLELG